MSRFVRPEMEVIHFTEADVIVSSAPDIRSTVTDITIGDVLNNTPNKWMISFTGSGDVYKEYYYLFNIHTQNAKGTVLSDTLHNIADVDSSYDGGSIPEEYKDYGSFNGSYTSYNGGIDWYKNGIDWGDLIKRQ